MTATRSSLGRGWATHLPLAFVMLALVALVALPVLGERYARPLNRELRDVVEPARGLVTQIHVSLAIEGSAFHDFLESADSSLLRRYEQQYAAELEAHEELGRLVDRLGDTVKIHFNEVRVLERRWRGIVGTMLRNRALGREREVRRAATTEEDAFEKLLVATAGLDDALSRAAQARRRRINEAEQMQRRFTVVVGLVALAAVGGVAWLAQRARVYAREAEERRVQLERATESRARLMRGVSHDLKNPLGAIDGHAALLEDDIKGPLNPGQRESVVRIRRSVRALLGLITDLLELSKAETGHLSVKPRPTNLADVVREAADEHRDAAEAAGHQLRTEISDGLPTVYTDPDRVRQVLGNLLSNAVKYTPSGGQIVVRAEERPGNGHLSAARCTAIDVIDSGPGIPAERMEEIFEEFSRLETGTTPGTGLGLTIARRISRLLGGDVSAASERGRGATFTLWLPVEGRAGDGRVGDRPGRQVSPA
ncbi:MAG: HAMP domain-containing histidine kinase [Gemmatimonadota bacterium]|nr:HAMP domain-containing histidine kinase [Gemmatimonadota bacterium]